MLEVPLAKAVIVANSPICGKEPAVAVFPYRDKRGVGYDIDYGASELHWRENPDFRLLYLHQALWFLAHHYKIPTDLIHQAALVIPEYWEHW